MAEPVLTASLLTPISIRLTWTYTGSPDFEVFWKSDHPAGQEFVLLGRTTGNTYDVGSLSWTTTYYFKVRAVSGATYGAFGNEINIFVCCGQAVVVGNPTPSGEESPPTITQEDFWQQAADPDDGKVAFVAKDIPHDNIYLWFYESDEFYFKDSSEYNGSFFPTATRKVGEKVAIFDVDGLGTYAQAYWFSLWDGSSLETMHFDDMGGNGFTMTWEVSQKALPYSMVVNSSGRIVIGVSYIDWDDWQNSYPEKVKIRVSNDWGSTWGPLIDISERVPYELPNAISMTEAGDGSVWILHCIWVDALSPYQGNQPNYIKYDIYKYVEGVGVSLEHSITTTLASTWDGAPFYTKTGWGANCSNANIYAEGSKIVICYVNDFVHTIPVGTPDYAGLARVYVDVSNDFGATWATQEVILPDGDTILWNPEWLALIPSVCIADGNLLVYLLKGTGRQTSAEPLILKSTDDGATWATVYAFPSYSMDYPWIFQLRSNYTHVTGTGCGSAVVDDGNLAFWESLDAGDTWAAREAIPGEEPIILSPIVEDPIPVVPPDPLPLTDYLLSVSPGAFSVSGSAALLPYTRIAAPRILPCVTGFLTVEGQSVVLEYHRLTHYSLSALPGFFSITGMAAAFDYTRVAVLRTIPCVSGFVSVSGQSASLIYNQLNHRTLSALTGGFTILRGSASLRYVRIAAPKYLNCVAGYFSVSGKVAVLAHHVPPVTIPVAPTGLLAVAVSDSQINLSWSNTATNIDGFGVFRGTAPGAITFLIATVGRGIRNYSDTGLPESTLLYYTVKAFNSAGFSIPSNVASDSTGTPEEWSESRSLETA